MKDLNALGLEETFGELTRDGCLSRVVRAAYDEDLGPGGVPGDITSRVIVSEGRNGEAQIASRRAGVLAGARCIPEILRQFAPNVTHQPHIADGERLPSGRAIIGTLRGPMLQVLQAERTLLNLLGRLSGVATRTAEFSALIAHTRAKLLDTRKTTPGLRNLEKYAVRCGGGLCHRIGLYDAVLIKDNHIAGTSDQNLAGVVQGATARARAIAREVGGLRFIELEVDRLEQLRVILDAGGCGVDVVLLDNMHPDAMKIAVGLRDRSRLPIQLEASGGVNLENIRAVAESGIDRISVGGLTHQAVSLDIGLDISA